MSHSAQSHTSFIVSCLKSSCKIKRNITIRPGPKAALNYGHSMSTIAKTYDTPLLSCPRYARGTVCFLFPPFYIRPHVLQHAIIFINKNHRLCSSDAKLKYREEQQPFWNVRGVQSRHGILVNFCYSCVFSGSKCYTVFEKKFAEFICTLKFTKHHSIF